MNSNKAEIKKSVFGSLPDGTTISKFNMKNSKGMEVDVISYGGIITRWTAPDKNGNFENVVIGFDSLQDYVNENPYFGAIIGRYCNRIANARFNLDGKTYELESNHGKNNLHGGEKGFDKINWEVSEEDVEDGVALKLKHLSKDGYGGFPGNLSTVVTYQLTENNELKVLYEATTDKKTIVNLTQHSYFNLSGDFSQSVLDHTLSINADTFLPVDSVLIPTGELRSVEDTPFDFRNPKKIGKSINAENSQLHKGTGYDHCWVLNSPDTFRIASRAVHPVSCRVLEVLTDEPGIQFYSGNFLDNTLPNPQGGNYKKRSGFCLETQHFPDSPNQDQFPSVVLNPDERYTSRTTFRFSVED